MACHASIADDFPALLLDFHHPIHIMNHFLLIFVHIHCYDFLPLPASDSERERRNERHQAGFNHEMRRRSKQQERILFNKKILREREHFCVPNTHTISTYLLSTEQKWGKGMSEACRKYTHLSVCGANEQRAKE
jgi:hypothetical protein